MYYVYILCHKTQFCSLCISSMLSTTSCHDETTTTIEIYLEKLRKIILEWLELYYLELP